MAKKHKRTSSKKEAPKKERSRSRSTKPSKKDGKWVAKKKGNKKN